MWLFQPRVEYAGHDLIAHGNCPAASKFDLLSWSLPSYGIFLLPSSVCVASIIDIAPSLKSTSNHYEKCSDFIIVTTSLLWDGQNLPFNYSRTVNLILIPPLFSFVTTFLNPPSSNRLVYWWHGVYINAAAWCFCFLSRYQGFISHWWIFVWFLS